MSNVSRDQYDFIVVGAGASGSVLAAELSASGAQVLVIESGGPDDAPTIPNPSIWFYNVGGPLDFHLPVTPSPRLNNRTFNMALGHVLGGGSTINAMVWTRGMQRDYDGWAKNGAKGWAFADVLPVFKSQETGKVAPMPGAAPAAPSTSVAQSILTPRRQPSSTQLPNFIRTGWGPGDLGQDHIPQCPSVDINGIVGLDAQGNSGLRFDVDNRYKRLFGFAALTSAFSAAFGLSQRNTQSTTDYGPGR